MKLTKEQKEELAQKLRLPWGRVELLCDGYTVTLNVERYKELSFRVVIYVNGKWDGKWFDAKKEFPEQKFLRKSVRQLVSTAERKKAEKAFGKRAVAKDKFWSGSITIFTCDWLSGKAALNHLCKVCESVQVAPNKESTELAA
ncbi:hypothetical protein ACO0K0_07260 [Undibacterium sp. SXout11W]|uniref:hypothetical protein n=1 Tax=Undibacterium sp. SXout11W TaxID=3413050 RepID=UPI003BF0D1F8